MTFFNNRETSRANGRQFETRQIMSPPLCSSTLCQCITVSPTTKKLHGVYLKAEIQLKVQGIASGGGGRTF